ncbi:hypothetical protein BDD12DRAFT_820850 [Trichophaea hybrida]|nr:hypothetical protein BDD12DRAFT_820850 [Trichophaea hybrida]
MNYSGKPKEHVGPWDPVVWYTNAGHASRLYNLPIHSTTWKPDLPQEFSTPFGSAPITFDGWVNIRPSWLAMHVVSHRVPKGAQWLRPTPPVKLSDLGQLDNIQLYITRLPYLIQPAPTPEVNVRYIQLPEYDDVWRDIVDGIDPISFWRFLDSPAAMQEEVIEYDRGVIRGRIEERVLGWDDGGSITRVPGDRRVAD